MGLAVERLLVFGQSVDQIALRHQLLALEDGDAHLQVGGGLEHPVAGIEADAAGTAEGVDHVLGIGAHHVDLLVFGFAVGFNAELDRHAEEIEVLIDFADGAEALVVAEPVNGVLVGEAAGPGAVDPLRKEREQLLLAQLFRDFLKVFSSDGAIGELAERAFENVEKGLVAHFAAKHVEDHGALFEGHGLELRREGIEAVVAGKRNSVIGQGAGGDIFKSGAEGAFAALVFDIHQLAVARHAVGDPGVVEGVGADFASPPLVGDGIGQQPDAGFVADARALNGGQLGGVGGGQGVVGQLDHVQSLSSGSPKLSVKKSYSLVAVWANWLPDAWWLMVR